MAGRPYTLAITRTATKQIAALPLKIQGQVNHTIDRLLETYQAGERPQDVKPIKGRPDSWRIDTGVYRILYEDHDDELVIVVFRVMHRRDSYRNQ